jgi:hypothetical protein
MPTKEQMAAKYEFNPEQDSIILRFPSGLSTTSDPVWFKKFLKLLMQAFLADIKISEDGIRTRLLVKPIGDVDEIANKIISSWITQLIMDPTPTKPKGVIPSERNHYTLSLFHNGVVYKDIFPITNMKDEEGYYEFSYYGYLAM